MPLYLISLMHPGLTDIEGGIEAPTARAALKQAMALLPALPKGRINVQENIGDAEFLSNDQEWMVTVMDTTDGLKASAVERAQVPFAVTDAVPALQPVANP